MPSHAVRVEDESAAIPPFKGVAALLARLFV